MSRTDLIADSLTILRNAYMAKRLEAFIPYSKLILKICEILKREGYIDNFRKIDEAKKSYIKVYLRYINKKSVVSEIKRVSKPSRRIYVKKDKIPYVAQGKGIAIISTSRGVLTDKEARKIGVGGELLFYIW